MRKAYDAAGCHVCGPGAVEKPLRNAETLGTGLSLAKCAKELPGASGRTLQFLPRVMRKRKTKKAE